LSNSARQYTEKFKSWRLHKYARRKAAKSSRRISSVHTNGHIAAEDHRSGPSSTCTPHPDATRQSYEIRGTDDHSGELHSPAGPARRGPAVLDPTLGTANALQQRRNAVNSTSARNSPGDAAASYPIDRNADNNNPGKHTALLLPDEELNGTGGTYFRYLHRIISSAMSHQPSSETESEGKKRRLKSQSVLARAIWQLWYAGVLNEFDSILHGLNTPSLPLIQLDVGLWLRLYPHATDLKTEPSSHVPLFPKHEEASLTWEDYAGYGRAIAMAKKASTDIEAREQQSLYGHRVVAAMMLNPARTAKLRHSFETIFTCFSSGLRNQYNDLENSCKRFREQFPLRLSESEEWEIAGYSIRGRGAAILAAVYDRQVRTWRAKSTLGLHDMEAFFTAEAGFSTERALVWAARLMLYYASPALETSPLPTALCSRALDGCMRVLQTIQSHPHHALRGAQTGGGGGPLEDVWQDSNFASIWAEWLCCDSDFFFHDSPNSPNLDC
jgi:hypothetical protein